MPTKARYGGNDGLRGEVDRYRYPGGRAARTVRFLPQKEAKKNPGVNAGHADIPPDIRPSDPQRGEADQALRLRNPQYMEDVIPTDRQQVSSGDALRPRWRPRGYSDDAFNRDYVANPDPGKLSQGDLLKSKAPWW